VKVLNAATVRPLVASEAAHFDLAAPQTGLMVVTADPKGPFTRTGILAGDALLAVKLDSGGLKALKAPKDLEDAIAAARTAGKENIVVSVGCGEQERCGDGSYLRPLTIKPE
jgi:S1-C subfamily serine protease